MATKTHSLKKLAADVSVAAKQMEDDLATLRQKIEGKIEELERLENAPIHPTEIKENVEKAITYSAKNFLDGIPYGHYIRPSFRQGDFNPVGDRNVWGALCAFVPDQVREVLTKAGQARADTIGPGVTEAERGQRIKQVGDQLYQLELAEERMHRELESAGFGIPRRQDARPEVVLLEDDELVAA